MPILLTPSMREIFYNYLGYSFKAKFGTEKPLDKLKAALDYGRIQYETIKFNPPNDFIVELPEVGHSKIKEIIKPGVLKIKQLANFGPIPREINPAQVQLSCPPHILRAFQDVLRGTFILGGSFYNPYTEAEEQFPSDANLLTARHLYLLTRNEDGYHTGKYTGSELHRELLSHRQVAKIRCFAKAITVAGITYPTHSGGRYRTEPRVTLSTPPKTIVIEQSGFQWAHGYGVGFLFFYPNPNQPMFEFALQKEEVYLNVTHEVTFGRPRAKDPKNLSNTILMGDVAGCLDLEGLAMGLQQEFLQALDAAVAQGAFLDDDEQINFIFLKTYTSGAAFFDDIEIARLQGIKQALEEIQTLPASQQKERLGKVGRIELPRSDNSRVPKAGELIKAIQQIAEQIGLQWGGTAKLDPYAPREGWVNATTSGGKANMMIGCDQNPEEEISDCLAANSYLGHLNVGFNSQMILRSSPAPYPAIAAITSPPLPQGIDTVKLELSDEKALAKEDFVKAHKALFAADKAGFFGCARKTEVNYAWDIKQIIEHAVSANNRSRQVCVALGWLKPDGTIVDKPPKWLKELNQQEDISLKKSS